MSFSAAVVKICDVAEKNAVRTALYTIAITDYTTSGAALTFPGMEKAKAVLGSFAGAVTVWDEANQKLLIYEDNGTATHGPLIEPAANDDFAAAFFLVVGN